VQSAPVGMVRLHPSLNLFNLLDQSMTMTEKEESECKLEAKEEYYTRLNEKDQFIPLDDI